MLNLCRKMFTNYVYKIESVFDSGILLALEKAFYSIKGRKIRASSMEPVMVTYMPGLHINWKETKRYSEAEKLVIWKAKTS